jgi:hypothetical protein
MRQPMNRRVVFPVAASSLVFTYLFFIEYLSPFRKVHIPYDLHGYHYPLVDYAFLALKSGHFPEWDWTIYCGQSFVGNIQAALFYPPTWLLFTANIARSHVSYQSLEVFELAHVWLAFVLCYLWLRNRRLHELACVFASGVFAYSGYMLLQLQHEGLIGGYTWFPLGFLAIDQAVESRSWRPFWKLLVASALCFLAGYPPTWVVFAISMLAYAIFSRSPVRTLLGAALSLAASFGLSAIQLLPAMEAVSQKMPELRYGIGFTSWAFYLSYLVPNYYNFGINVDIHSNPGKEYLYLGAPAFLGLLCLARRRDFREILPALGSGLACLIFLTNPYELVWDAIRHSALLAQVVRDWYFLAGVSAALAALSAYGLDDFLRRKARPLRRWLAWVSAVVLAGWSAWSLYRWLPGGPGFDYGLRSIADPVIFFVLFASAMHIMRAEYGRWRVVLMAALLLSVGIDYKVFGTSKRVNTEQGSGQPYYSTTVFQGMDPAVYAQIRAHDENRILIDIGGPSHLDFRHYPGLRTPQGFDPLISTQYRQLLDDRARFRNGYEFEVGPDKQELLRVLGVRYYVGAESSPFYAQYRESPVFRQIGNSEDYYRIFEYRDARPSFGWDSVEGSIERGRWTPEIREFAVRSATGGRFALHEQFAPGWQALIDGQPAPVEHWSGAFQAVPVPAGEHRVQFRYRSRGLRWGAWISLASALSLVLLVRRSPNVTLRG